MIGDSEKTQLQNLQKYIRDTFSDQRFLPANKMFHSTEDEIKLQIPTDTQGYQIMTPMGCQVSC